MTQNAEQAIQEAGGCSEACEAGTIQYTEQLGNDGKWYPVLTRSDNAFGAKKGVLQKVKRVTLIEPSEICLKRAALHVSKFCPDAEIVTVNKSFDDLDAADIVCDDNIPTLHILSNVLDLLVFDLERFAGVINEKIKGFNQIVCVSPFFGFSDKDRRMREFCALLNGEENYSKFFDKYELNPNKPWTAQIRCFSVANLEEDLSTEVTDEDIDNGFKDEYGVVYSRYGKRLLKCKNMGLKPYIVKNGTKVICNGAFYNCASLQQITIPNSVTSIGVSAFDYCDLLQQIIIPEGSESKFSQMLPKKIWNKLYCLKQVRVVEPQVGGDDLPF